MSEFLDELARSLAEPMPRRRAVKVVVGAVAAATVPGLGAMRASAAVGSTRTSAAPATRLVSRRADETCTSERPWSCSCPAVHGRHFQLCCFPDMQCHCRSFEAECVPCKGDLCTPSPKAGYPPPEGGGVCCPPDTRCTFNNSTAACCGKEQSVAPGGGECRCPSGTTICGTTCCNKKESCINGECCLNASIFNGVCCEPDSLAQGTKRAPYCCPPETVAIEDGKGCCPPAIPNCCEALNNDENQPIPVKGFSHICVSGGWTTFRPS